MGCDLISFFLFICRCVFIVLKPTHKHSTSFMLNSSCNRAGKCGNDWSVDEKCLIFSLSFFVKMALWMWFACTFYQRVLQNCSAMNQSHSRPTWNEEHLFKFRFLLCIRVRFDAAQASCARKNSCAIFKRSTPNWLPLKRRHHADEVCIPSISCIRSISVVTQRCVKFNGSCTVQPHRKLIEGFAWLCTVNMPSLQK